VPTQTPHARFVQAFHVAVSDVGREDSGVEPVAVRVAVRVGQRQERLICPDQAERVVAVVATTAQPVDLERSSALQSLQLAALN
jgi:hypothetical protein